MILATLNNDFADDQGGKDGNRSPRESEKRRVVKVTKKGQQGR